MKQKLLKGALWVILASLFVKVLSIVYKIPYQNLTGDKGYYIYQQTYPLYALLQQFGSFALPLALSETLLKEKNKERVLSSSLVVTLICGLIFTVAIISLYPFLGTIMGDTRLNLLFLPLVFVLLLIPFLGVVRGYLYHHEDTIGYVGVSTSIEQLLRIIIIIIVLILYVNNKITNLYHVACFSLTGYVIGIIAGLIVVISKFSLRQLQFNNIDLKYGYSILKRSVFLLLSATILLLMQVIDSFTIINTLIKKMTLEEAMVIKGIYDRSLPLIQTALFYVFPLLSTFIPHAKSKYDFQQIILAIVSLALPATVGLIKVMPEVNILLFKDRNLSHVLQVNMAIIYIYALVLTYTSMMTSKRNLLFIVFVGLLLKCSGNLLLISQFGIIGACLSNIIALLIMLIMLIIINRKEIIMPYYPILKVVIAVLIMLPFLFLVKNLYLTIIIGIVIYGITFYLLKIHKYFSFE